MNYELRIINDVDRAIAVMRQTAMWMQARGIPLTGSWELEKLNFERFARKLGTTDKNFFCV